MARRFCESRWVNLVRTSQRGGWFRQLIIEDIGSHFFDSAERDSLSATRFSSATFVDFSAFLTGRR